MKDRDDSVKMGVLLGYLIGLRHRARSNGWEGMVVDITKTLKDLGLEE